jgi:anaerobic magnesium-protoporphyrin IX monomethyl ester cyclase
MQVLLIYPDICPYSRQYHHGIGYLSAMLKSGGHSTFLLHLKNDISERRLVQKIGALKPDLIAISTTAQQFPYARKYARSIKQHFPTPIICGGIHPTLSPDEVISSECIDIVCVGEGEYTLLELAEALERRKDICKIADLWVKREGLIYQNPRRPLLQDLDKLPFPDREIFGPPTILRGKRIADVIAGRGCPYDCTYCCNHGLRKVYSGLGKFLRYRSVANVLLEIQKLRTEYGVQKINFDDETFTLNHSWLRQFCGRYASEIGLPFGCNARVETLNREILGLLKESGCEVLRIGIESGNEWLRREVLHRNMTNEQIKAAFDMAHEVGLNTLAFNMIGIPFETPEMAEETIALNRQIDPNQIQCSVFFPYPGTHLYQVCKAHDFLTLARKSSYFQEGSVLNLPTLSNKQIVNYQRKIWELILKKELQNRRFLRPVFSGLSTVLGERLTFRLANLVKWRLDTLARFLRRIE